MTWKTYAKAAVLIAMVLLWGVQAQTILHVALYVMLCLSAILGFAVILPHLWILIVLLTMWWGASMTFELHLVLGWLWLAALNLFGRNLFYRTLLNYFGRLQGFGAGLLLVPERLLEIRPEKIRLYDKS